MNYDIHLKQLPPEVIVTERCRSTLAELGEVMHATLAKIASAVRPRDALQGAPFAIYYNSPFARDDIDVEMGVPLAWHADLDPVPKVERRHLPGGPVAYTFHVGPYETIGAAYDALYDWLKSHGRTPAGPPREIYLVGPGEETNPAAYRTEIAVPV